MKVLHVIDSAGVYGAERMLISLARQHATMGIETELASLRHPHESVRPIDAEAARYGITVHAVKARRGIDPQAIRQLGAIARQKCCDILHSHSYKANTLVGVARPWHAVPAAVATLHGWSRQPLFSRMGVYEAVERQALRGLTRVVAVNERMAEEFALRQRYGERLVVIRNGVEPVANVGCVTQRNTGVPEWLLRASAAYMVLAVGRLDVIKRYDLLIEATFHLRTAGVDASLVILGEGPERNRLAQLVQDRGLNAYVHMPGYVADARAWMKHFDALAITSDSEGIPVNMLEAMVEGVPVVARRVGGIPEVIEDRQSGLLAQDGSARTFSALLAQLVTDQRLAGRLRTAAREAAIQRHSLARMACDYQAVYLSCLKGAET